MQAKGVKLHARSSRLSLCSAFFLSEDEHSLLDVSPSRSQHHFQNMRYFFFPSSRSWRQVVPVSSRSTKNDVLAGKRASWRYASSPESCHSSSQHSGISGSDLPSSCQAGRYPFMVTLVNGKTSPHPSFLCSIIRKRIGVLFAIRLWFNANGIGELELIKQLQREQVKSILRLLLKVQSPRVTQSSLKASFSDLRIEYRNRNSTSEVSPVRANSNILVNRAQDRDRLSRPVE